LTEPTVAPWAADSRAADVAAQRLLRRVLCQWWLIALCAIVAAGAAFVASSSRAKQYEASSTLEIGSIDLISIYLADSVQVNNQDPDRLKQGALESFQLPNVRDRAVQLLGGKVTSEQLAARVRTESVPDSGVIRVIGRDTDPTRAKEMTNAMVNAFIAQRLSNQRAQIVKAKKSITEQFNNLSQAEKSSTTGQILQQRLRQVGVLGTLDNGNVDVIQGARTPKSAVSPKPKRDTALGFIAGLLLGLGIAVLRARLDDRVRDTDELTELWELPVVGLVPQTNTLKESGRAVPEPAALEALSLARTNLRYLHVGGSVKTVVITSALESEGKSTVAWNLAIAAAMAGTKILVVEADLRRPKLTSRLGLSGNGLSEVLAGISSVDEAISTVEVIGADGATIAARVDVMPAGLVPPSPVALLEGEKTAPTFAELRERYDVVLIDTPPSTVVADAVALVGVVDGVLIVSRLGVVRRAAHKRLREIFTSVDATVIGQIINSDAASKSYGYYSSYAPKAKRRASASKAS
jgi:capsular exopolysaccharide synthesis family protein